MKRLHIIIMVAVLLLASCGSKNAGRSVENNAMSANTATLIEEEEREEEEEEEETADGSMVYVCTGPTARTYHATPNCRGLSRCSGDVVELSEDEAVDELQRRPCKICNY